MNCISHVCHETLRWGSFYEASIMVLFDGHKIFVWWDPFQLYLMLYDGAISRVSRDCDDRTHILFGEITISECFRHFIWDFEVRSLWQGMTKQIINNSPDLDLEDILHNSVVTRRRTRGRMIFLITLISVLSSSPNYFPACFSLLQR